MVGPGTLTFDHAAVHQIDSSREVFRLLAIGVVRLLGLPYDGRIPEESSSEIRWLRTAVTRCRLRRTHLAAMMSSQVEVDHSNSAATS